MGTKLFSKKNMPVYPRIKLASGKAKISIYVFFLCRDCISFEQLKERKQSFVKKLLLILAVPQDKTESNWL